MLTETAGASLLERLTVREYALIAISLGALLLAFLPMALYIAGTGWSPGMKPLGYKDGPEADRSSSRSRSEPRRDDLAKPLGR